MQGGYTLLISYLHHSGFAVETKTKVLVFDYYTDPENIVRNYAAKKDKPLWFFVSHNHGDHFNQGISTLPGAQYVVNEDVPLKGVAPEKLHPMALYDKLTLADTTITQYGSTDEGGSFLVETDGLKIFHAGDLNWWHWLGDTEANNAEAKANFVREMSHLQGQTFDVAFFPVDARLEGAREWGVLGFLQDVHVTKCLVPMHYFGAPWQPSRAFQEKYPQVPLWIPAEDGEQTRVE